MRILNLLIVLLAFTHISAVAQDLRIAAIFSDNMVLQQQTYVPLWGWARKGSKVSITTSWDDKTYETVADKVGKWRLSVETPAAGGHY